LPRVTEESSKSVEAFTHWLYSVVLKLSEVATQPEADQVVSSDDWPLVMDFLLTHLSKDKSNRHLNLEVVSQFFLDKDLALVQETDFQKLTGILSKAEVPSSDLMAFCDVLPKSSLNQLVNKLEESIEAIFRPLVEAVSKAFVIGITCSLKVPSFECSVDTLPDFVDGCTTEGRHLVTFPYKPSVMGMLVTEGDNWKPQLAVFELKHFQGRFAAVKIYDRNFLSIAMETSGGKSPGCALAQLSIEELLTKARHHTLQEPVGLSGWRFGVPSHSTSTTCHYSLHYVPAVCWWKMLALACLRFLRFLDLRQKPWQSVEKGSWLACFQNPQKLSNYLMLMQTNLKMRMKINNSENNFTIIIM
jgi:hypothetical protein